MAITMHTVSIVTTAGGAYSTTLNGVGGRFLQYRYVPDGSTPLDTGADLDITGATTGYVYVNQDNIGTSAFTKAPRQPTHDETGAASLYAAAGEPVEDHMFIGGEVLNVVIAQGGATKLGTLYVWTG